MKLYKYVHWRPFNKECDLNKNCDLISKCYTRENLLNSALFFNSPKNMNDPFDTIPFVDSTGDYKAIKNLGIKTIMFVEGVSREIAKRKAIQRIKTDSRFKNKKTVQESAENIIAKIRRSTGICCFTTNNPTTLLMWAHYGDKHEGICLEFDFPDRRILYKIPNIDKSASISSPQKVIYSNNLPPYNIFDNSIEEMSRCLLTKSEDWSYEHEYRMFCQNYVGLVFYQPHLLTGIYAGYKMHEQEFAELQKTINKMKFQPRLYQLGKNPKQFSLDIINV